MAAAEGHRFQRLGPEALKAMAEKKGPMRR
jgi:hypothetical protein